MKDDLRITKKNTAPHENDSIELKEKSNYRESIHSLIFNYDLNSNQIQLISIQFQFKFRYQATSVPYQAHSMPYQAPCVQDATWGIGAMQPGRQWGAYCGLHGV